ncbi:hypothetical protein [Chitinophaga sp. LS1]|uniref:hypothetical protein n=1 Tax=Chitinophaga sp. LS1 TaxID=3051176 RepID=UPI002AABA324|nr:hypothetical protein [Chitinophaga sp. LS1]WPV66327.1 hypothetical protein QQL36_31510 [Chitinophaga sp. LS1]
MADKLFIADERILQLMEYAISTDIVDTQKEFLNEIGFGANNLGKLRNGERHFTPDNILKAATMTGANLNWIFGLEKNMLRDGKKHTAIDLLKSAVIQLESELQGKNQR